METALTAIDCPACGRRVSLMTRDQNGLQRDQPFEPAPYYVTADGTHDIENARAHGQLYPDVFVARCRVLAATWDRPAEWRTE